MTTRSTIAIDNGGGTASWIQCFCDGHPQHNGRVLLEHWNSEAAARALVDGGDANALRCDGAIDRRCAPHDKPRTASMPELRGYQYTYLWSGGRWMLDGLPLTTFDTVNRDREYDEHKLRAIAVIVATSCEWVEMFYEIGAVLNSKTDEYRVGLMDRDCETCDGTGEVGIDPADKCAEGGAPMGAIRARTWLITTPVVLSWVALMAWVLR